MIGFNNVENLNYLEFEQHRLHNGIKPLSVHFPLNLPYQQGLIYSDCAFNVYYLPLPPDLNAKEIKTRQQVNDIYLDMVNFLFGEAPFIPDFRQSVWSRSGGRYPISKGELSTWEIKYVLEYCVDPASGITYVRATVTNTSDVTLDGVVRLRASRPKEIEIFDYHYCPFRWDNRRFDKLVPSDDLPQIVSNDGFEIKLNDEFSYKPEDYNTRFGCSRPYVAGPEMQILEGKDYIKFSSELAPGASASFTIAIRFEGSKTDAVLQSDFDAVCRNAMAYWDGFCNGGAKVQLGNEQLTDSFYAVQWNILQLMLELESEKLGGKVCQPCQGGSTERFFVWTWEAVEMMRPMIKLGYFDAVKRILDFIFRLQDGGYPPEGEFSSLRGAVGTTGPRWANTTGAALLLATDYAVISKDQEFIKEYTSKIIAAARWILGEVKATQKYNPDGSKVSGFGIMPLAVANDGDYGRMLKTDLVSLQGVEAVVNFLEKINAPEYMEIAEATAEYRENLRAAVISVSRGDGYINRRIPTEGESIAASFERAFGGGLMFLDVFDPRDPEFDKVIPYTEKNRFDGRFCSPLFDRIYYIGNTELEMFCHYLKLGQWKKALLASGTFRSCAMTPDLYLLQERYSAVSDSFTPWQPNASNNGRYLELLVSGLYLEDGEDRFILAGGISPAEFASGGEFSFDPLYTLNGQVQFSIKDGRLSVKRDRDFITGSKFCLPEYFQFIPDGNLIRVLPGNTFEMLQNAAEFSGSISLQNIF